MLSTVVSGVLVFIIGQAIQKYLLEPYSNYRKARANILQLLIANSNLITSTLSLDREPFDEQWKSFERESVRLGSELIASTQEVPFYNKSYFTPTIIETYMVASDLRDLGNNVIGSSATEDDNKHQRIEALNRISNILKFKLKYEEYELITHGEYKNGKSLKGVLEGTPEALSVK
ncbi:hypothetical protein [Paenibacillus alvei]|uniref:hypothetical protein n=1 Tax=Paenibacillus alvei TaxID=44250 RepID=UPI0018CE7C2E|nr:hypothetical protein [Paenibacillus alvei]MBG9736443.1 hypothetical protein [Paenibacillus alvei]MBG9736473.1 hypothetical protein [Paenibacillus alvei]MBG9736527.1 hypothetical protein [Paenibacillus alvei]MBG9736584.1 hypothetical protein [Paenibacillus alvei]MBG9745568.1 hypothetical protein [Paenibacillus alvei]